MEKKKSVFDRLSAINVNDHVEKKSNLTYLSWAWAWAMTKRECPDATYKILETDVDDALGFMCHTSVTIEGETLEMWLPVMDGANKSMKKQSYTYSTKYGEKTVEPATTFDINKTLMRCLVKNLAMFGLGIYIYAGEDLPEPEPRKVAVPVEPTLIDLVEGTANWDAVVNYVTKNKALGVEKIGAQLVRKYRLGPELKKKIVDIISQS